MSETNSHSSYSTLLIWLVGRLLFIWERFVVVGQQIMKELHLNEYMDMAAVYLVQHPVMALFALAMALCCAIPVLMFVVFALLSVILTFTGFIVIEGTILTIGSVLLCGFLLGMLLVMFTLAATIGVAYFGFMEIYGLLQNSPENSPVSHYLTRHLMKQETEVISNRPNHFQNED
ncbi:hypothetical protein L9F63_016318 [Diploptera punctata]|uniref:Promethin n=1 Tax=Diploptera punctata TaxID=6984 RepID=A0AAD8A1I1_DIPPU|nr:hypothetical protein L9F63_016318 [Diploptera punctata]